MAILVGPETKVICQGMTGRTASYHIERAMAYGTNVVGGVRPGKGGTRHLDTPVFDTVSDAVAGTGADASIVFVPPPNAANAMIEAIEAEVPVVVCVTERVPVLDMVRVKEALEGSRTKLVGPNSQGVLSPRACKLGVMSTVHELPGSIGIVSRSATLTSEIVAQTSAAGLGQSTTVGIGGDPVHGIGFAECLKLFLEDPDTHGVILIGEIRTRETMDHSIAFAETGHLCLATLHANNANQAMDRVVNFFSEDRRNQLLMDLSLNLKAIVAQQLIPAPDGQSRVLCVEILINTPLASDLIKKGEVHALKELMGKSREQGMQTFDQHLYELYRDGKITYEDAINHADSANGLRLMIKLGDSKGDADTIAQGLDGVTIQETD